MLCYRLINCLVCIYHHSCSAQPLFINLHSGQNDLFSVQKLCLNVPTCIAMTHIANVTPTGPMRCPTNTLEMAPTCTLKENSGIFQPEPHFLVFWAVKFLKNA